MVAAQIINANLFKGDNTMTNVEINDDNFIRRLQSIKPVTFYKAPHYGIKSSNLAQVKSNHAQQKI